MRRRLRHKRSKAVAKITMRADLLLEFLDHPSEQWIHLRTTNPIESTFATVSPRQRVESPRTRCRVQRALRRPSSHGVRSSPLADGPRPITLAQAGATFSNGKIVE